MIAKRFRLGAHATKVVLSALLLLSGLLLCVPQISQDKAFAEEPSALMPFAGPEAQGNVNNRINQLKTLYPVGSYFTASKSACGHTSGVCTNCQLSYIMKSMGYAGSQGIRDAWTCVAFGKFAFWYIFGVADTTFAYSGDVPSGATKVSLSNARLGDLVIFNGHYGIYLGMNGNKVSIFDANSVGKSVVGYNVTYFDKSTVMYVLHAKNYDLVNSGGDSSVSISRLYGSDRYSTMSSIIQKGFAASSANTVIVATGENYPDALAASGLAGMYQAPIVLTSQASLTAEAKSEIARIGAKKAIIVGSEVAVSASVESSLSAMGVSPKRLAGTTRIETALEIYKAGSGWSKTAIVASGSGFADALSISSYAYAKKMPIFLTDANKVLTKEVAAAIKAGGFTKIIIVGDDAVVSKQVETQLKGYSITRLGGSDRYDTSFKIAQYLVQNGMSANNMAVATGVNFPDALAGAALCGKNAAPILLVADNDGAKKHPTLLISANKQSIKQVYILGSDKVVSASLAVYLQSCFV